MRVLIEKIRILDHKEPWWKGRGEIVFDVRVYTPNFGGIERLTRLPESGFYSASKKPRRSVIRLEKEVFNDYVVDELAIQMSGTELDTFDPNDYLGMYQRAFVREPKTWFGSYGPGDEPVEPESLECWQVWYRIEPA
ncbi:MAG: hypothetical protein ACE5JR_05735 [Gemmatimonadota bacterium]